MTSAETQLIVFVVAAIFAAGGHFWLTHNHIASVNRSIERLDERLRVVEGHVEAIRAQLTQLLK